MGSRGPIPRNEKVAWLHGETRPSRQHRGLKLPPKAPDMPGWLSPSARRIWREVVPELDSWGIISQLDRGALTMYCVSLGRAIDAEKVIAEEGITITSARGVVRPHPAVKISHQYRTFALSMAEKIGLTPASRARLRVPERPDTDDPLEQLLRSREWDQLAEGNP